MKIQGKWVLHMRDWSGRLVVLGWGYLIAGFYGQSKERVRRHQSNVGKGL